MSIKDLFGKTSPSLEETVQDVESVAFVEEKTKADQTYHPQIDFSDPENFAYYGSAELYYDAAIRRIYEDYPYDGSKSEQIEFEEKASALERWVFENKYPKTTGHIQLGTTGDFGSIVNNIALTGTPEYIRIWGGLHTDSSATNLADHFESSARYDSDKNRNQNWNCDFDEGVTVEFWMKKESFDLVNNPYEIVLDLWNGDGPATEKRLVIGASALAGTNLLIASIKDGLTSNSSALIDLTSLTGWNHFAFTFYHANDQVKCDTFVNGDMVGSTTTLQSSRMDFTGKVDGFIGALQTVFNSAGAAHAGKFQGYLDEFRFWKTKRTSRQIKLNWFNGIGGGANTDDATSDLGVYLKFNEGIVGTNAADSVVLDYSGRLANGVWVGYENTNLARSTDSAMETVGYTETPSPIIYKEHPSVSTLISEMQTSGSVYDADRGQSFFRSMPTWLQEEDNGNFRLFSQILASYMDTLHVQIKELTELKTKRYPMEGVKASTMAADLLKDKGFMISNMFESNEVYEKLASINLQDTQFETELHEIKNIIYTNIYNNLEKIYKTKGTEGSIRNLIRCYGIDDELIKLNLYTDGGTQYFTDKSRETSVKKKYINFNDPTRFEASIYQVASSANPNSFISSAVDASRNAFTMEADIVVPYKKEIDEKGYFATPFLSASVMGFHEANANPAIFTWGTQNLSVYLVRDSLNSRHAKFVMRDILGTINEESDYIYDIYENEHYNVALRIKPQTYPYAGGVTNTTPSYDVELYAVTTNFGEIENEVILSKTISNAAGLALMNASKRVYVGAHTEDFTGVIQQETDLQIGGVRAWLDYLGNDEILQHNKDVLNYGMRSSIDGSNLYLIDDVQIPSQDLTIFNWDFDTVTATDSSGEFIVEDITSGSADTIYGWIDDVIRREHKAKGSDFASNDSSIIDYEFIQAYKKQLPESAYDAQSIYIKGDQEINFSDDDDVSDNLFIMEKSPASLISEEMLKSFSTTLEFANLFMRPIERFRVEYKDLARARQLFFERVESDMDFDKFFEYFKWIDSSISSMVNQLVPMSANFAGGIVDVIEPHILERDKYQRQVGLLSTVTSTEASIRGAQELKYNWRVGHAPLSGDENENCLWQKERKENDVIEEEAIRQVLVTQNALTASNPINLSGSNGVYAGNTYATRRLSRPYTLDIGFSNSIHGGINYSINKDRDMIGPQIAPGSQTQSGAPENVVIVGAGVGLGTNPTPSCTDEFKPQELRKLKYDGFASLGKEVSLATLEPKSDDSHYIHRQKISKIIPGNIVSSSVNTGYSAIVNQPGNSGGFAEGYNLVNLHSDTTDITNEISIQGPFTETHVGGRQSRHIHYMEGFDQDQGKIPNISLRPELWNIYLGALNPDTANDGAIGFTGPDYSVGILDYDQQKATLYREERAKRPVNIKNIQTIIGTGSHGNFTYGYEVMSTFGDQGYFLRRSDNLLPDAISQELPETTNYLSLVAQDTLGSGNVFGTEESNRHPDGQAQGTVSSQGYLEMAGTYVAGTVAVGEMYVTGAHKNATFTTGEFSVPGKSTYAFNSETNWDGAYIQVGDNSGSPNRYEAIWLSGSLLGREPVGTFLTLTSVSTGSTDNVFFGNIESSISAFQNFTVTSRTDSFPTYQAPEVTTSLVAPTGFESGDPTAFNNSEFTWVFNLNLDTSVSLASDQILIAAKDRATNQDSYVLYVDSRGDLFFKVFFDNGGTVVESTFDYGGFWGEYVASGMMNLVISYQYNTSQNSTDFSLSIEGDEKVPSSTGTSGGGKIGWSFQNSSVGLNNKFPATDLNLFGSITNSKNFIGIIGSTTYFSNKFNLGNANEREELYYNGYYSDYAIMTYGSPTRVAHWDFRDDIRYDAGDSIVDHVNTYDLNVITSGQYTIVANGNVAGEPRTSIAIRATQVGAVLNDPFTIQDLSGQFNYFKEVTAITSGLEPEGLDEFDEFGLLGDSYTVAQGIYDPLDPFVLSYSYQTSVSLWNHIQSVVETNSNVTITRNDSNAPEFSIFTITTNQTGSALNQTITTSVDGFGVGGFYNPTGLAGGTDTQGAQAGDEIRFINQATAEINEIRIVDVETPNEPNIYYVRNDKIDTEIWDDFSTTLNAIGIDDVTRTISLDTYAEITMINSSGENYSVLKPPSQDNQTFRSIQPLVGGTLPTYRNDVVVETQDRSTGSANVIRTRFSAPGGPEVNSSGYLDVATQQYSVHNSINFRNLTTRASGSGEADTIRLDTHQVSVAEGRREGLRTLRTRHQGKFGIESQYGAVSATDYNSNASFHKQHRNTSLVAIRTYDEYGDETSESSPRHDNDHYHRPLPSSDFAYSWINNALNGADAPEQYILGHAPKNGMIKTEIGYHEAIKFSGMASIELKSDSEVADHIEEIRTPVVISYDAEFQISYPSWIDIDNGAIVTSVDNVDLNMNHERPILNGDILEGDVQDISIDLVTNGLAYNDVVSLQTSNLNNSLDIPNLYFSPNIPYRLDCNAYVNQTFVDSIRLLINNASISEPTTNLRVRYPNGETTVNQQTVVLYSTYEDDNPKDATEPAITFIAVDTGISEDNNIHINDLNLISFTALAENIADYSEDPGVFEFRVEDDGGYDSGWIDNPNPTIFNTPGSTTYNTNSTFATNLTIRYYRSLTPDDNGYFKKTLRVVFNNLSYIRIT